MTQHEWEDKGWHDDGDAEVIPQRCKRCGAARTKYLVRGGLIEFDRDVDPDCKRRGRAAGHGAMTSTPEYDIEVGSEGLRRFLCRRCGGLMYWTRSDSSGHLLQLGGPGSHDCDLSLVEGVMDL